VTSALRAKAVAFTMGYHERLGATSRVRALDLALVDIISNVAWDDEEAAGEEAADSSDEGSEA